MNQFKYRKKHLVLFVTILIICAIIIFILKSFNEWNRSFDSYKPEIINKFYDNKNMFDAILSYTNNMDDELAIEVKDANYITYKYNDMGGSYYSIEDKSVDTTIRNYFSYKFESIDKDRGAVYFVYRNDWGGGQGIVYSDDLEKLVRYKYIVTEEIDSNWYYFIGQ